MMFATMACASALACGEKKRSAKTLPTASPSRPSTTITPRCQRGSSRCAPESVLPKKAKCSSARALGRTKEYFSIKWEASQSFQESSGVDATNADSPVKASGCQTMYLDCASPAPRKYSAQSNPGALAAKSACDQVLSAL